MAGLTVHFLLVYSYDEQALIEQRAFSDADDAVAAYRAAEDFYRGRSDKFEVVLVGADSIETVMRTHGHYFAQASDTLFADLVDITSQASERGLGAGRPPSPSPTLIPRPRKAGPRASRRNPRPPASRRPAG